VRILTKAQLLLMSFPAAARAADATSQAHMAGHGWGNIAFASAVTGVLALTVSFGPGVARNIRQTKLAGQAAQVRERETSEYWRKNGVTSRLTWKDIPAFCLDHPKYGVLARAKNPGLFKEPLAKVKDVIRKDIHPAETDPNLCHTLVELSDSLVKLSGFYSEDQEQVTTLSAFAHTTKEALDNPSVIERALRTFLSGSGAADWREILDYKPEIVAPPVTNIPF